MLTEILIPARPRRWHLQVQAQLRRLGHEARLAVVSEAPVVDGLEALAWLEARLYRAGRGGGESAPVDIAQEADGRAPDLLIDLTGRPATPAAGPRRLVPLFDGAVGEAALLAPLLEGRAPAITVGLVEGDGLVPLASGLPALEEPHRVIRSLDRCCARLVDLLVLALPRLAAGGETAAAPLVEGVAVGRLDLAGAAVRQVAGRLQARLQRWTSGGHEWRIAWRSTEPGDRIATRHRWPAASYTLLPDDGARYYADPFLFAQDGRTWLFCEEFPFATGRGILSVVEMGPQGPLGTPRPVLEQACHLSYPQVFAHGGAVYMVPETSARGTVELWRAEVFPDRWHHVATLVEGATLADATLLPLGDRWWLFAALEVDGQSSWDTLGLYSASRLEGPWQAQSDVPAFVDSRCARPAGRMWQAGGAVWRPVQDCSRGYGSGLGLARVSRLEEGAFAQELVARLAPPPSWRARGVHTVDACGAFEVIDVLAPPMLQLPAADL